MTDLRATPLRDLVEARRDEIKAIVARHHGRSVAIAQAGRLAVGVGGLRRAVLKGGYHRSDHK